MQNVLGQPDTHRKISGDQWLWRVFRILYLWAALQIGQSWAMEARADVSDHVRFNIPPIVLVFTGDDAIQLKGRDASLDLGRAVTPAFAGSGVLVAPDPILTNASWLGATSDRRVEVRIASNTAIAIEAQWRGSEPPPQDLQLEFRWTDPGTAATLPSGLTPQSYRAMDLTTLRRVTTLSEKTASESGTPHAQSVALEITWDGAAEWTAEDLFSNLSLQLQPTT